MPNSTGHILKRLQSGLNKLFFQNCTKYDYSKKRGNHAHTEKQTDGHMQHTWVSREKQ